MTDTNVLSEAEELFNARDDEDAWGKTVAPTGAARRLDAMVTVKFSADELGELRAADPDGMLTEFIHDATLKEARERITQREGDKDNAGFTIVELLIVIVVLGILASVVIFALGGITERPGSANSNLSRREAVYATNKVAQAGVVLATGKSTSLDYVLLVDQSQLVRVTAATSIQFSGTKDGTSYFTVVVAGHGAYPPSTTCLKVPTGSLGYVGVFGACKTGD